MLFLIWKSISIVSSSKGWRWDKFSWNALTRRLPLVITSWTFMNFSNKNLWELKIIMINLIYFCTSYIMYRYTYLPTQYLPNIQYVSEVHAVALKLLNDWGKNFEIVFFFFCKNKKGPWNCNSNFRNCNIDYFFTYCIVWCASFCLLHNIFWKSLLIYVKFENLLLF